MIISIKMNTHLLQTFNFGVDNRHKCIITLIWYCIFICMFIIIYKEGSTSYDVFSSSYNKTYCKTINYINTINTTINDTCCICYDDITNLYDFRFMQVINISILSVLIFLYCYVFLRSVNYARFSYNYIIAIFIITYLIPSIIYGQYILLSFNTQNKYDYEHVNNLFDSFCYVNIKHYFYNSLVGFLVLVISHIILFSFFLLDLCCPTLLDCKWCITKSSNVNVRQTYDIHHKPVFNMSSIHISDDHEIEGLTEPKNIRSTPPPYTDK